ncbi:hypothetical protein [Marinilabilia rubra]|nr:hypothetical protein [Marinilabilia rubra]
MNKIFNPFHEIAGSKALFLGLLAMLATGLIGYFSHTHFPDIISIKYIPVSLPLWYYFIQQLVIWLIPSVIFYLLALLGASSSVRIIDVFGTQALARYPYVLASITGFSGSMKRFGEYIIEVAMEQNQEASISSFDLIMSILIIVASLLLVVWMVGLMYNAFRISANLKGARAVGLFIAGFAVSFLVSLFTGIQLYNFLQ